MVKKRNTLPTNDTSNLVNEIDDNTKSNGTENKIIAHDHCNSILLPKNLKKFTGENFAARLAKANLASKNIVASVKKTNFDYKLNNGNKKVTSNKTELVEAENNITNLTNKLAQISEKGYDFLLSRIFYRQLWLSKISSFLPQCLVP